MKITLPLSITIPRKTKDDKVFKLNLNIYRNAHYITLNTAKVLWKEIVWAALLNPESDFSKTAPPYHFVYTIYGQENRAFDVANVGSVVDKFTSDALQEFKLIKNDNYKFIPIVTYKYGGVDKDNPRVELEIKELQK